jgi:hypothetical protein
MEGLKLYDCSENPLESAQAGYVQMLPLENGFFCFTIFSGYIFLKCFSVLFKNLLEGGLYTICALC